MHLVADYVHPYSCRARYGSSTTRPRPPAEAQRRSTLCCSTLMRFGRSLWVERGGATRSALQAGSLWTVTLSKRSWAGRSSPKHPPPPWPVAIREDLHARTLRQSAFLRVHASSQASSFASSDSSTDPHGL